MAFQITRKLILSIIFGFGQAGYADYPSIQYEKALTNGKNVDLSALFKGSYSEIRWDKNRDGIIDIWSFSKGNISIQEIFNKGTLVEVQIRKRAPKYHIALVYHAESNFKLSLVKAIVRPYRTYFNEQETGLFEVVEENSACVKTPISKYISSSEMKGLVCKTTEVGLRKEISELVQPSCSENMNEVIDGLEMVYGLNFSGYVEDNKVLNCLAKSESTSNLVPDYLRTISSDTMNEPKLKIACENSPGPACGKASYDALTRVLKLPVTNPLCQKEMAQVFGKNIFHETVHRTALDDISESSVQNLVDGCLGGKPLALESIKFGDSQVNASFSLNSPAGDKKAIAATNTLAPPADTRNLAAQPGTLIATASSRDGALNSAFRSIASASQQAFNPNQAYRESVQRTAPSFAIFEAAVNKFVPPASAASAQWLNSRIPSNSSAGVAVPAPDISGPKRSPSSNSAASSTPTQRKAASQTASREVANVKTGSTDSRTASGGSQSDLGFSSKGTSSNEKETSSAPSAPSLSPQQQRMVTEIIQAVNGAKSPSEAKALLKKNNGRLLGLKVHVYDPKAPKNENIYGLPSTDGAAKKFSLINGKLVPE